MFKFGNSATVREIAIMYITLAKFNEEGTRNRPSGHLSKAPSTQSTFRWRFYGCWCEASLSSPLLPFLEYCRMEGFLGMHSLLGLPNSPLVTGR